MTATFNITVNIEENMVTTCFGSERIENMDTTLLAAVLKEISNVENRIKTQLIKHYGVLKNVHQSQEERTDEEVPAQAATISEEDNA